MTPDQLKRAIAGGQRMHRARWGTEDRRTDGEQEPPESGKEKTNNSKAPDDWSEPKPLPIGLAKVESFCPEFLPDAIAPWVSDIAERLQCPTDYVAVAAITALGSVIGRRVGIKPQAKTDWAETANLWGMFIGRPGMLKSPAMMEALKPLHFLEAETAKENEIAAQAYAAGIDAFKLRKRVMESLEKEALKTSKGEKTDIRFVLGDEPKEPLPVRYRTNDSTYEAVGELLIANPTGILIERDELVSLLKHLDRDEQAVARGFFLSGWAGSHPTPLIESFAAICTLMPFAFPSLATRNPHESPIMSDAQTQTAAVVTVCCKGSASWCGPTSRKRGRMWMNIPTARPARQQGSCLST
jgi:hypothetical protein